jgi:hypothetical protein
MGQPEYDVSKVRTTLLGEETANIGQDVSHLHTTLLSEPPEASTLPRTQRLPVPPIAHREPPRAPRSQVPHVTRLEPQHAIRPDVPPVTHPERTSYLSRQPSAPLALPDLPPAESRRLAQNPVDSHVLSGPSSEAEVQERTRAQREADAAEAARWRRHADAVSEQIQVATAQFATMTARWRALVHMARRTEHEDEERVRLEVEVPRLSQRLARARKRWTECLVHAREYEERAAR